MIKVNFINQYDNKRSYKRAIKKIYKKAYEDLELIEPVIISVVLVDNEAIHEMNKNFRDIDKPTDVLSFENQEGLDEIGDVIISLDMVSKQAKELDHSFEHELVYLAVHGFLHCLGYDHIEDDEAKEMDHFQKLIMNNTKYTR